MNQSSGRVAVVLPTNALINEDGGMEERVQLVRPLNCSKMGKEAFADSGWKPVDEDTFARLWQEEVAAAPEFTLSTFYLITGLLLPVWSRLPQDNMQVCRLQTDDGQKLLGRVVQNDQIAALLERFELTASAPVLSAQEILDTVMKQRRPYQLQNGMEIRVSTVMGNPRIEITGFREAQKEALKALGCIIEIISWQARLFVPVNDNAPAIIERLRQVA